MCIYIERERRHAGVVVDVVYVGHAPDMQSSCLPCMLKFWPLSAIFPYHPVAPESLKYTKVPMYNSRQDGWTSSSLGDLGQ